MDNPWKQFERKIGALLGLPKGKQRTGPTGMEGFDVIAPPAYTLVRHQLGIECKYQRDGWPKWLMDTVEQCRDHVDFHQDQSVSIDLNSKAAQVDGEQEWFDWVIALGYKGAKKDEILAVLPMEQYLRIRKDLVACRRDLQDVETTIRANDPVYDSSCVSLSRWRELYDRMMEVTSRCRNRLKDWTPDMMYMGKRLRGKKWEG